MKGQWLILPDTESDMVQCACGEYSECISVRDQRSGSWEETSKSLFRANEIYEKAFIIIML